MKITLTMVIEAEVDDEELKELQDDVQSTADATLQEDESVLSVTLTIDSPSDSITAEAKR